MCVFFFCLYIGMYNHYCTNHKVALVCSHPAVSREYAPGTCDTNCSKLAKFALWSTTDHGEVATGPINVR